MSSHSKQVLSTCNEIVLSGLQVELCSVIFSENIAEKSSSCTLNGILGHTVTMACAYLLWIVTTPAYDLRLTYDSALTSHCLFVSFTTLYELPWPQLVSY